MRNFCNLICWEQWYFSLIWNTYMWKLQTFCGKKYKQIIAWFVRDIWHKYHSRYFKIVSNFTRLTTREITYNNFEISLVVFMPNITTNHAITYTNSAVFYGIILQDKLHSFSIQDDLNTRSPSTTNHKNNSIIKRLYIENSPLDGTVQSGQSAVM